MKEKITAPRQPKIKPLTPEGKLKPFEILQRRKEEKERILERKRRDREMSRNISSERYGNN